MGLCEQCRRDIRPTPRVIVDDPVPVVACVGYRDPVPGLVTAHKDRGAGWLTEQLGAWLACGLAPVVEAAEGRVVVVPVPSSSSAVRRRGADHAAALAVAAVRALRCGDRVAVRRLLRRTRRVADQLDVSRLRRVDNQRDSMTAVPGHGSVVVVDDVRTSGATLDEAHRALSKGGYTVLAEVVLADAATPSRWPSSADAEVSEDP